MLLKLYDKNNNPQDLQRIIDILNDGAAAGIAARDGKCSFHGFAP